jgi:chromate transporter
MNKESKKGNVLEVSWLFFKMGLIAFGGPAAHIAMMEREVIEKRKWMSKQHFLDLIGATNLIPGPNSTEMTMHCGHERAGVLGLFAAGFSFIFPAVVITGILAYLYVEYGELPNVAPFILGIKPAVLAIIAAAIFKLGKKAIKTWELAAIGVITMLAATIFQLNEVLVLLGTGLVGTLYFTMKNYQGGANVKSFAPFLLTVPLKAKLTSTVATTIFWKFLKVGAILYGSGYVLFAYLDAELVEAGLMTRQELLDAIAVGQFTPGPVLSTATFVGYQLGGFWGSLAATAGIFLPSFIFVLILNPLIPKMRQSKVLSYFLDSVNVAAVGIMAAVLVSMGTDSVLGADNNVDWRSITIAVISFGLVFGVKNISSMWIVVLGSVLGYALSLV